MHTVKTLKPGQDEARKSLTRFGPSLLCVRYRYSEDRREHVKAVELIVQRRSRKAETERLGSPAPAVRPSLESGAVSSSGAGAARTRRVALRIGWRERDLQQRVKSAGGRWDSARRAWYLRRDVAERLDLLRRMAGGGG